jgi:hypothetical protein
MIRSRVGKERASSSPHFGTETTPAESLANVGLQLGVFLILNINNDDIRASLSKWNADLRDVVDSPADLFVRVRATVTFLGNELLTRLYSYKYLPISRVTGVPHNDNNTHIMHVLEEPIMPHTSEYQSP